MRRTGTIFIVLLEHRGGGEEQSVLRDESTNRCSGTHKGFQDCGPHVGGERGSRLATGESTF